MNFLNVKLKRANFKSHIDHAIIFKNSETTKPNNTWLRDTFVCGKIMRSKENGNHYIQFCPQEWRTKRHFG